MGIDLFSMPSDNFKHVNKVSGDNEVMELIEIQSEGQNYFELDREGIRHLAHSMKLIGTDVAMDTSKALLKLLSDSDSEWFIFHLG